MDFQQQVDSSLIYNYVAISASMIIYKVKGFFSMINYTEA